MEIKLFSRRCRESGSRITLNQRRRRQKLDNNFNSSNGFSELRNFELSGPKGATFHTHTAEAWPLNKKTFRFFEWNKSCERQIFH